MGCRSSSWDNSTVGGSMGSNNNMDRSSSSNNNEGSRSRGHQRQGQQQQQQIDCSTLNFTRRALQMQLQIIYQQMGREGAVECRCSGGGRTSRGSFIKSDRRFSVSEAITDWTQPPNLSSISGLLPYNDNVYTFIPL